MVFFLNNKQEVISEYYYEQKEGSWCLFSGEQENQEPRQILHRKKHYQKRWINKVEFHL